jgi:hypothetical protein
MSVHFSQFTPTLSTEKTPTLSMQTVKRLGLAEFRELDLLSKSGKIRLLPAQRYFNENDNYFPLLPQLYDAWRNESEYLVFKHVFEGKTSFIGLKCAKRGNDVYNARIKRRFGFFNKNIPDLKFFSTNPNAFKTDTKVKTKLLWVTLSWDPRLFSIRNAWKIEVGKAWNRFISALRRRYGKVFALRSWETYRNGYPHIHAVLWFESAEFTVFPHYSDKEKRLQFRIQEKHEFEPLWHSWIDIEALSSMKKMANYVLKYQLKVHEGKEPHGSGSNTLAFMWLFRKRSYACSRELQTKFIDSIEGLHNSNMENDEEWEFLGVFSGRDLGLNGEWIADIDWGRLRGLLPDGDPRIDEGISSWD